MRLQIKTFLILLSLGCQRAPQVPAGSSLVEDEDVVEEEDEETIDPPERKVVEEEPDVEAPPPIALTADVIKGLCAETKLSKTTPVTIPARLMNGCTYGVAPNGPAQNGNIRAREIDTVNVPLTPEMVICDVQITSRAPALFYNDDMYFLMDKYVIASDIEQFVTKLTQVNGLYLWDFAKIYDSANLNSDQKIRYCAGGVDTCVTQEIPSIEFSSTVTSALIAPIASELVTKDAVTFSLIVTGDDPGDGDCLHDEYPLDFKIDYVLNPNMAAE